MLITDCLRDCSRDPEGTPSLICNLTSVLCISIFLVCSLFVGFSVSWSIYGHNHLVEQMSIDEKILDTVWGSTGTSL